MLLSDVCLSDVCLSRTLGKTREQRPMKTKIGTQVAHVTRDWDTTFKVKRSRSTFKGVGILWWTRVHQYSLHRLRLHTHSILTAIFPYLLTS